MPVFAGITFIESAAASPLRSSFSLSISPARIRGVITRQTQALRVRPPYRRLSLTLKETSRPPLAQKRALRVHLAAKCHQHQITARQHAYGTHAASRRLQAHGASQQAEADIAKVQCSYVMHLRRSSNQAKFSVHQSMSSLFLYRSPQVACNIQL